MNPTSVPPGFRDGVLALVMAWVLLVDGSLQTVPQPHPNGAHSEPPRILYIYREFWKPHTQAALDRIETKNARMCIDLKCPYPYLGIESRTGSKEVWYLNGFTSTEEQKRVAEECNNRVIRGNESIHARESFVPVGTRAKDSFPNYRPELGHGVPWSMGQGRFLPARVRAPKSLWFVRTSACRRPRTATTEMDLGFLASAQLSILIFQARSYVFKQIQFLDTTPSSSMKRRFTGNGLAGTGNIVILSLSFALLLP